MAIHVFHQGGYEPQTVLVRADSEIEARGKAQDELPGGVVPSYEGTADVVIPDSDVIKL